MKPFSLSNTAGNVMLRLRWSSLTLPISKTSAEILRTCALLSALVGPSLGRVKLVAEGGLWRALTIHVVK